MVHQMTNTSCQLIFVHPDLLETALAAAEISGVPKSRIFLFSDEYQQSISGVKDWRTMLGTDREGANWKWQKLRPEEAITQIATVNFSSGHVPSHLYSITLKSNTIQNHGPK
jgi:4-coumarate--CoA ligase